MSNDPASGGDQPGWHGQQPYPGGYGQQQPEQPAYGSCLLYTSDAADE